jgi:hypothetical protein
MWEFAKTGVDGNCVLFGVNIFDYKWINTGQKVRVADPLHKKNHSICIYNVTINQDTFEFAAGELSNCVYGFYTKKGNFRALEY